MYKVPFQLPETFWFRESTLSNKQFNKIEDLDKDKTDNVIK